MRTRSLTVVFETDSILEKGYELSVAAHLAEDATISRVVDWILYEAGQHFLYETALFGGSDGSTTKSE